MTSYDPFSSLQSTTEQSTEEEYYDETICANHSGYYYQTDFGVFYGWNGLPDPAAKINNDPVNVYVAITMTFLGILGLILNGFCAKVIFKNSLISRAVKYYLLFDCYCRLNEAWSELYKVHCVLTWDCVNPDGWLVSGIAMNRVITSFSLGMVYSMQMLGNGLACNRICAVFHEGRFYPLIERFAFVHSLILWVIPIGIYCYQIGNLVNAETGFTCYGCWYFSPMEYCNTCMYGWDDVTNFLASYLNQMMYGVLGFTMFLDILTLWRVRKYRRLSETKKRTDIRLSIMLVTTHLITIFYLIGKYIVNNVLMDTWPINFFLIIEVTPFLMHCMLGLIVLYFNLEPKRWKKMPATSTVTMFSRRKSSIIDPGFRGQTKIG